MDASCQRGGSDVLIRIPSAGSELITYKVLPINDNSIPPTQSILLLHGSPDISEARENLGKMGDTITIWLVKGGPGTIQPTGQTNVQ